MSIISLWGTIGRVVGATAISTLRPGSLLIVAWRISTPVVSLMNRPRFYPCARAPARRGRSESCHRGLALLTARITLHKLSCDAPGSLQWHHLVIYYLPLSSSSVQRPLGESTRGEGGEACRHLYTHAQTGHSAMSRYS